MTNLGTKIVIGISTAIGGGGSIYGGYLLITKQTIKERLEGDGYKVLDTNVTSDSSDDDNSHWNLKINSWTEVSKFISKEIGNENNEEKIKALKNKCESVLNQDSEDSEYENAKKHCAIKKENTHQSK